ncbi:unnamed protein product [Ectocarpus sp. 13 AM-2016]
MTKERVWATAFFMLAANRVHLDSSPLPRVFGAIPDIDVASSTDVLCWETHGEYEFDCFHDEPLVWKQYPLTPEMLQRTVPYNTSDVSLHRAFKRAKANGVLKVVAIGGSVTFGRSCESPKGLTNNACAWPHRLDQWFRAEVGDFKVEVVNEAVPGEGMIDFLHRTIKNVLSVDVEVDIVIVDFGVNDAILDHFDLEDVKMAHETFISHVRNVMTRKPALLYAESFIAPRLASLHPLQGGNMAEVHANVTQKYDIPMASFRHVVWPDITDSSVADVIWGAKAHPPWQVHQLMADVVVYYMQKSHARFLEANEEVVYGGNEAVKDPLSNLSVDERELERFKNGLGCLESTNAFELELGGYLGTTPPSELISTNGWSILRLAGAAGLTGFGNCSSNPAVAVFDLPCVGEKQILDVEYLVSYEGMGAMKVSVGQVDAHGRPVTNNSTSVVVVDGLWGSHVSIPAFESIDIPDKGTSAPDSMVRVTLEILSAEGERLYTPYLFAGVGNDEEQTSVRGDRKFKLLSLQCC